MTSNLTLTSGGVRVGECYPIEHCLSLRDLEGWGIDVTVPGLLALPHPRDTTDVVFPAFQFAPAKNSSAFILHPIAAIVVQMLGEAGHDPNAILKWWFTANAALANKQPRDMLMAANDASDQALVQAARLLVVTR